MQANENGNFRVVCLGGSAGGLAAYVEILRGLTAHTGMAVVIAPHRGIQNPELLPNLLSGATAMPVLSVVDGMRLKPNQVFVMPPHKDMTIAADVFRLREESKPHGWPITINIFLCSLAENAGNRAVAVIVSGMDHDGSAALQIIKAAGGKTLAQSDAEYDEMPRHAVETGHIDFLLPSAAIAKVLQALAQEPF